ncbi:MAG: 50S ribosomal protein L23 [Patescibacteria group bacterium]|jgi:ribosomal protein L23
MRTISLLPLVTEKSLRSAEGGVYTFIVPRWATKLGIAQAVRQAYKVTVEDVNIAKRPSKPKRRGATQERAKAIVRLKAGEKIAGFELSVPTADDHDHTHEHDHAHDAVEKK